MTQCPICETWHEGSGHVCPPKWTVVVGPDAYEVEVFARSPDEAAEKAVELYDEADGDYPVAGKNETIQVKVTGPSYPPGTKVEPGVFYDGSGYDVEGEFTPSYIAREAG